MKRIAFENRRLQKQGRSVLSRYHASDCSSLQKDYAGWSVDEQINHAKALLRIISRRKMLAITCGVSLKELADVFPDHKSDALEKGYMLCFRQCMGLIARSMAKFAPNERIALFHDRCPYDHEILRVFNSLISDAEWESGKFFVTVAPLSWMDGIALQAADLIAFESFKLLDSKLYTKRQMRRFLRAMLGERVPIISKYWHREGLENLRNYIRAHPDESSVKAAGFGTGRK